MAHRPDWIEAAKLGVENLWEEYKIMEINIDADPTDFAKATA